MDDTINDTYEVNNFSIDYTINYLKQFLLYGNEKAAKWIGYTRNEAEWGQYKLVIVPGKNILTGEQHEWTIPDYNKEIQTEKQGEIIDEFGETMGGTWVIREDLLYNTLFLLSQAELTLDLPRDEHGRLSAHHSILGQQGLLTVPILDEYARLCTKLLEQALPEQHIAKIYLTHDVDFLELYRHLRGFLGGIKRGKIASAILSLHNLENDPAYTFHWLHDTDQRIMGAKEVYFLKATNGKGKDYPQYNLHSKDLRQLLELLDAEEAVIGLHGSYYATDNKSYSEEKKRLEEVLPNTVSYHRNHYLRINNTSDLQALANAGITDDFSLGWADHVGFRFGTTRAAQFINPNTLEVTNLKLHPLNIMDCTLSNDNYMNLDEEEAFYACQQIVDKVKQHGGELTLLWHNTIFLSGYHKQLYTELLNYIQSCTS